MALFGDLLQRYRIAGDKTLESTADLLGVSALYLSQVELCKKPPFSRTRIEKLAVFFNVNPEPLIEEAIRERGFVELDMAHLSSLQLKTISKVARGEISEEQWAEIYRVVYRRTWEFQEPVTDASESPQVAPRAA